MIKNVILDMGNVLLDYNPRKPVDYYFTREEDKKIILQELFQGPEWIQGDLGYLKDEDRFEGVSSRVPERLHEGLRQCVLKWHAFMEPIEGAREFTESVKQSGYRIFILSNASDAFYDYFPKFRPLSFYDGVVVSADLHIIKPDPRIYEYLLSTYQLKAEECLFVDDREENVEAARNLGIYGYVFDGNYEGVKEYLMQISAL